MNERATQQWAASREDLGFICGKIQSKGDNYSNLGGAVEGQADRLSLILNSGSVGGGFYLGVDGGSSRSWVELTGL